MHSEMHNAISAFFIRFVPKLFTTYLATRLGPGFGSSVKETKYRVVYIFNISNYIKILVGDFQNFFLENIILMVQYNLHKYKGR